MGYNKNEVLDFCYEMIKQLELHDKEKGSVDQFNDADLHNLIMKELDTRLHIIKMTGNVEVAKLQSVHMANFLFIWFNRLVNK